MKIDFVKKNLKIDFLRKENLRNKEKKIFFSVKPNRC